MINTTTNTMALAWSNARCAATWHNKGKASQYISGSMVLAHKSVDLKELLTCALVVACPAAVALGCLLGYTLASI